jgi:peptide-methionine (S)-S-oxide reductase
MNDSSLEKVTIAGGCFWCTEAIFKRLKGVEEVQSGYVNSEVENPRYEQVSTGKTGAAEGIQIAFNPNIISFEKLLEIFFKLHDPTTLNQQGADIGTQYRSGIYYISETQRETAKKVKEEINQSGMYKNPLVTEITPLVNFTIAEDYHKDFYNKNKTSSYCRIIIDPKITKLYKEFKEDLKESADS